MEHRINKWDKLSWSRLLAAELLTLGVGSLGGFLAREGFQSYGSLAQPPLSPPAAVFPIVWTVLYLLMGYSVYRIGQKGGEDAKNALTLFAVYMVLNFLWPTVFFVKGAFLGALLLIIAQLVLLIATFSAFYRLSAKAAFLLIPTGIWTLFAAYLNAGVFILNS